MNDFPSIGHGIGLRPPHFVAMSSILHPVVDWVEVISENFMVAGGNPRAVLRRVRERMPVVLHGVSLSLGSVDPLDARYLDALDNLAREIEPAWLSDHLCWSSFGGHTGHDLWPLPFTEDALSHVVERVMRVQDRLGRRILVENVSSYLEFASSSLTEWEFLAELCRQADCGVLLDVNNVFVSAYNHGFSPHAFLDGIPVGRVGQIHLAGHSDEGTHLLDTHDHPISDGVWDLYRAAVARFGPVATLIERDDDIPPLDELVAESRRAAQIEREVCAARAEVSEARPTAISLGSRLKRDGLSAKSLRTLQELFYDLVTAPTGVGPALAARGLADADLEAIVVGDHRLPATRRLDIYAEMYFYRILDVLREEFPRVVAAVGDVAFHDFVTDYLLAHRPSHPSLREAGAHLAAYLAGHALGLDRPWLAELASLERAHRELFDGQDVPSLSLEMLRGLPADGFVSLAVQLSPTHTVFNFAFALSTIWGSGRPPHPREPEARSESLLVWRQDFEVRHREVDGAEEAAMLAEAAGGATMAELCQTMIEQDPQHGDEAPARAFQILARWVDDGLVIRKSEMTVGESA